jgi:hypothetical protein
VAVKKLTAVETDPKRSNQHEFQGIESLRAMLGEDDSRNIPARFVWLSAEQEALSEEGFVSWSNVRKGQIIKKTGRPRSPEYHLYYSSNGVTEIMRPDDLAFFAKLSDGTMLVIIAPAASTMRSQMMWLFGIEEQGELDEYKDMERDGGAEADFAARFVLDEIGIEIVEKETETDRLDELLKKFGSKFPTTKVFSELARFSLTEVDPRDGADAALLAWLEREEAMFKRLERKIVAERLESGFMAAGVADVDTFISYSLGIQNRRKARAGQSLEHHVEAILTAFEIDHVRGAETENKNKPDFLFPSAAKYHDPAFEATKLTMLGSKSTCKDRWRQVLSEASRIPEKHLLTLEPAISENQTDEMAAKKLQLVLPKGLHSTYKPAQQRWLWDVSGFIAYVKARQDS